MDMDKKTAYSPDEQFALGERYYHGNGVEQNYQKALEWYERAASQGFEEAISSIGYMYSQGKGVRQNNEKAVEWYSKAANKGYAKGQFNLAVMYLDGRGVPKDIEKAKKLFASAAENGDTDAQAYIDEPMNRSEERPCKVTDDVAQSTLSLRDRAQKSQQLFYQAQEQKRNGQYQLALKTYKQAYVVFPEDQDLQSTMYAMAKVYLLIGDYEKACALFQDGLTQKLFKDDERVARFYNKYLMEKYRGTISESDPEYVWFKKMTADYSIFIGLTHYLLENNGADLLSQYRDDFNNHIKSVAGKASTPPSREYLVTCYEYGWIRVLAIASESYNRCFDKIDLGHVQKRKQEFLDILETI